MVNMFKNFMKKTKSKFEEKRFFKDIWYLKLFENNFYRNKIILYLYRRQKFLIKRYIS